MGTSGGITADTTFTQRSTVGTTADVGQFVPPRDRWNNAATGPPSSGTVLYMYFYADHSETISTLTAYTGTVAAGATPTICRMGLNSVAANGDLTQVASTPNDTSLFAATNTAYPKALSVPLAVVKGQLYAASILIVTAAAMPTFHGYAQPATAIMNTVTRVAPAYLGRVTGQSDLPASVAVGSLIGYQNLVGIQLS